MASQAIFLEGSDETTGIHSVVSKRVVHLVLSLSDPQNELDPATLWSRWQVEVELALAELHGVESVDVCEISRDGDSIFIEFLGACLGWEIPLRTVKR